MLWLGLNNKEIICFLEPKCVALYLSRIARNFFSISLHRWFILVCKLCKLSNFSCTHKCVFLYTLSTLKKNFSDFFLHYRFFIVMKSHYTEPPLLFVSGNFSWAKGIFYINTRKFKIFLTFNSICFVIFCFICIINLMLYWWLAHPSLDFVHVGSRSYINLYSHLYL
jgi:hypothetical protein